MTETVLCATGDFGKSVMMVQLRIQYKTNIMISICPLEEKIRDSFLLFWLDRYTLRPLLGQIVLLVPENKAGRMQLDLYGKQV